MRKNLLREVRSTLSRFIAIFAITALGAGFFVGLKSTGPDMAHTADLFYARQHLADYRLLSTMGFTEEDIEALRASGAYSAVMASYGVDALVDSPAGPTAVRLQALPLGEGEDVLNRPILLAGRLPEAENECLADSDGSSAIGDVIRLSESNSESTLDLLNQDEFTVVGLASSPAYISHSRGNTNVGNGRISQFYFLPEAAFSADYYTDVYLRDAQAEGLDSFSDEYAGLAEDGVAALEDFGAQRAEVRYQAIVDEAEVKLADAEAELAKGRQEYEDKRAEAETELADAEKEIRDGEAEAADGQRQIDENAAKLAEGEAELTSGEGQMAAARAAIEQNRSALQQAEAQYSEGQALYEAGRAQYEQGLAEWQARKAEWQAGKDQYDAGLAEYQKGQAQWEGQAALLEGLRGAKAGVESAAAQLGALLPAAGAGDAEAVAQFSAIATGAAGSLQGLSEQLAALPGVDPALPAGLSAAASGAEAALAGGDYAGAITALSGGAAALGPALDAMQAGLNAAKLPLDAAKTQLDASKAVLDDGAAQLAAGEAALNESKTKLDGSAQQLAASRAMLDAGWQALADGEAQLAGGLAQLDAARAQIAEGAAQLEGARGTLADARAQLAEGRAEYEDAKATAEEEFAKAEQELADGEAEIADARAELADLEPPEWYVFDREANPGYTGFASDTHRIDSIALIFPVFFFLVATLICLTTMTRMVEENRTQIGTLKALGYSKGAIAFKYLFYGILASLAGSVTGVLLCSWLFPVAIWNAYSILYVLPPLTVFLHPVYAPLSVLASVLCTVLATLSACMGELRSVPATLMRPKAPDPGKRILLERLRPLWRRMSFNQKVTSRNIFRYKKRFLMTVVGVAGCSALLLTGFGLRDSISGIVGVQFGEINLYDAVASLEEPSTASAATGLNETLPGLGESLYASQNNLTVRFEGRDNGGMTTSLYVAEDPALLQSFIVFKDRASGRPVPFPQGDGVLITEKLAGHLGVRAGDTIELMLAGEPVVQAAVAGVVENYIQNYVYIAPGTYQSLLGKAPEYDTVLLRFAEGETRSDSEIVTELIALDNVAGAMDVAEMRAQFNDMLQSLDSVIWVVILSAGLLAFVVLYNLTNININERAREIATLKVLGFYPREVGSYIFRESFFLTLIGSVAGLGLGVILHSFVIKTAEIDEVMFLHRISLPSFLLSVLFTLLCMGLVDLVMVRRLKKIDMIESLKSAE